MSLLMQALRKAERAKRNHPHGEDDMVKPSEEFDDVLELAPPEPPPRHDRRATDHPELSPPDAAPGLALEPLDDPLALAEPSDFAPQPREVTPTVADPAPWRPNRSAEAPAWTLSEADGVHAAAHPSPMPGATVPDDSAAPHISAPAAYQGSVPARGLPPDDSSSSRQFDAAAPLQGTVPARGPSVGDSPGPRHDDGLQPLEAGGTRVPPPDIPASRVPHDASQGTAHASSDTSAAAGTPRTRGTGDGGGRFAGAGTATAHDTSGAGVADVRGTGAAGLGGADPVQPRGSATGARHPGGPASQHVHAADLHGLHGAGSRTAGRTHANTFEPAGQTLTQTDPPRLSRTGPPPRQQRSAAPAAAAAPRGFDARTIRIAALLGVLVIVAGTFGYIYWRAVYGPGSSKNLPAVPMPGLSASTQPPSGVAAGAVAGGGTVSGLVIPNGAAPAPTAPYVAGPATAYQPAPNAPVQQVETMPGISAPLPSQIGAMPTPPAAASAPAHGANPTTTAAAPMAAVPASTAPLAAVPPTSAPATGPAGSAPLAAAPAPAVPLPTPEQLRNLSPEDYMRMDRQAAAAADAEAQRVLSGASATAPGGVTVRSSAAAASTGAPGSAAAHPGTVTAPVGMPPVASGSGATVQVSHSITPSQVSPVLQGAYTAYRQGDLEGARTQYNAMLAQDATNRDAQLGLAAIALRERQPEQAAALYGRLLQSDPNDPDAMAGMASIRGTDASQAEARLRRILAASPEAPGALYALGNLYARQSRWSEAQAQFFKAFAAAPDNADYAFNLAVSLDRVNKPRLALDYYQRAIALAESHTASFDRNATARRIRELGGR